MKRELDPSLAPAASLPILSLTRRVARVRRGVRVAAWALMGVWSFTGAFAQPALNPPPRPSEMPVEWEPLVGDYGPMAEAKPLLVLEREGQLWVAHPEGETQALARVSPTVYATGHAVTPEALLPSRCYVATTWPRAVVLRCILRVPLRSSEQKLSAPPCRWKPASFGSPSWLS